MRRSPFVLTATAAGLAGVLTYHAHTKSFAQFNPTGAPALTAPQRARAHRAKSSSAAQKTSPPSSGQATGAAGAPSVPTPLLARQGTGPLVPYGYGELAVTVTLSGGKITAVNVTGLRTADQYSQSLAQQVVPMLRSEVLQAQSANINGVSGATYTSEAFAMSLQSALKHLGV